MSVGYCILLTGMNTTEENSASSRLSRSGHTVITAGNLKETVEKIGMHPIDVIYLKAARKEKVLDGLKEIARINPSLPVVIACDHKSEDFVLSCEAL